MHSRALHVVSPSASAGANCRWRRGKMKDGMDTSGIMDCRLAGDTGDRMKGSRVTRPRASMIPSPLVIVHLPPGGLVNDEASELRLESIGTNHSSSRTDLHHPPAPIGHRTIHPTHCRNPLPARGHHWAPIRPFTLACSPRTRTPAAPPGTSSVSGSSSSPS